LVRLVWGGILDTARAVNFTDRYVFTTLTRPDGLRAFVLQSEPNPLIDVEDGFEDIPGEQPIARASVQVRLRKVLRMSYQETTGRYRVIFIDDSNRVSIINDAIVSGQIPCQSIDNLGSPSDLPQTSPLSTACAEGGIDVRQLAEFVAPVRKNAFLPRQVIFP
jgi:hypothetical protein